MNIERSDWKSIDMPVDKILLLFYCILDRTKKREKYNVSARMLVALMLSD